MRVVVDTNCLRASIPPHRQYYQLYVKFRGSNDKGFNVFEKLSVLRLQVIGLDETS